MVTRPLIVVGVVPVDDSSRSATDPHCACVTESFDASADEADLEPPSSNRPDLFHLPITSEFELYFNPSGGGEVALLNRAACQMLAAEPRDSLGTLPAEWQQTAQHLAKLGFWGGYPSDFATQPRPRRTLSVWLHTTNACNLRCTYCFLRHSDAAMDAATGRSAVDAALRTARRHGFTDLQLKYAGGESSLAIDLVRTLHEYACQSAARDGIALHEVLLSNGVALSRRTIEFLQEAGIQLSISLDGVGAAHDAQRPFANGQGSYKAITGTIARCIELGLQPAILITITEQSAPHLAGVVAFALEHGLRFSLNFQRSIGSDPCAPLAVSNQALIEGVRKAFAVIAANVPRERIIDGLLDRVTFRQPHQYACGAGHSYLVIDQNGGVAPCQMQIARPSTSIWADDPLLNLQADPHSLRNAPVHEHPNCAACTWRNWCAGGCPLYAQGDGSTGRSPYCEAYRALLPELLRLEGLRLLRWEVLAA